MITCTPMHLLVQARRTKAVPIFAKPPLQSDYTVAWKNSKASTDTRAPARSSLSKVLPGVARLIHVARTGMEFHWRQSLRNRRFLAGIGLVVEPAPEQIEKAMLRLKDQFTAYYDAINHFRAIWNAEAESFHRRRLSELLGN